MSDKQDSVLGLEDLARLQSEIERASSPEEALRAHAMTSKQWLEAERRWLDALTKEVEAGSSVLAERYLIAFYGAPPAEPALRPSDPIPAPAAAPAVHMPSYIRMGGGGSFLAAPAPPVAVPSPPIAPSPAAPAMSPPASVAAPRSSKPSKTAETATPKRRPTLPFQTPARPVAEAGGEAAAPVSRGRRRRPSVELPAHIAALKGTPAAGGTVDMEQDKGSETASTERKSLSVAQFAWLVATVEMTPPGSLDDVLARMRMTRDQYVAMGAEWKARMERDPALAAAFAAALSAQRANLRGPR